MTGVNIVQRLKFALAMIALICLSTSAAHAANEFFVSPNGSPGADGSRAKPWDLQTALSGRGVPPGSTIFLLGGTYVGVFQSSLSGTAQAPITVRSFPGQWAVISDTRARAGGGTITIRGAWTIYRDFEVTNTNPDRSFSSIFRPMAFDVYGPNTKFINLVIHDTGHGIGAWREAVNAEIYGNVIYNCGSDNEVKDQGHGHGIYSQNDTGTKVISDNVVFDNFGWGLHVWPGPGNVQGYDIEGNVFFNNGILSAPERVDNNLLVNGHSPYRIGQIRVISNYTYNFPSASPGEVFYNAGVCLLCTDPHPLAGNDIVASDNYFVGGAPVMILGNWRDASLSNNVLVGDKGFLALGRLPASDHRVALENNSYFGHGLDTPQQQNIAFKAGPKLYAFAQWPQATGLDRTSHSSMQPPTGTKVFVRANRYEPGRANIIVYNWSGAASVQVDVSSVLQAGTKFEVLNAQNFFAAPLLTGTYDGHPLSLPMTGLSVAQPIGHSAAPSTSPQFAVFILRSASGQDVSSAPVTESVPAGAAQPSAVRNTGDSLSKFVGMYVHTQPLARAEVRQQAGALTITILTERGVPTYSLEAVSANRFRILGMPAGYAVQFEVVDNQVRSVTIERGSLPAVVLTPQK